MRTGKEPARVAALGLLLAAGTSLGALRAEGHGVMATNDEAEGCATVAAVAPGGYHTCARAADGSVWCWGNNTHGQLGDGTTTRSPVPVRVRALDTDVAEVATGWQHTCARKTDGTLWCWGLNRAGQLGGGTMTDSTVPVPVRALGASVAEVATGSNFTCARKTDGTLWCWGANGGGQLGDGTTTDSAVPVPVRALGTDVVGISAGAAHACARKGDGTLWCWGLNSFGAIGDGTTTTRLTPVPIHALGSSAAQAAAGHDHTCARKTDGTLWCWGNNATGELGDGTTTQRLEPVEVRALGSDVAEVAAGDMHTCARKTDGTLWCWGWNLRGELGDGTATDRSVPAQVRALGADVVRVAAKEKHTCAIKAGGTLWCWGDNGEGQLGYRTLATYEPLPIRALGTEVAGVALGGAHACAGKADGAVWCWGSNWAGQLGDGTAIERLAPMEVGALGADVAQVAAGAGHTCARKADGTLWCWGSNVDGQLGDGTRTDSAVPVEVGALGADVAQVAAGFGHTCARKTDGTLWCWGSNVHGQLGDGTVRRGGQPVQVRALGTGVAEVATGSEHTCARKADGSLWCWGYNLWGRLGDGTTTQRLEPAQVSALGTGVAEVAAGSEHTCARKTDGTLWCWGDNTHGQLGDGTTTRSPVPVEVRTLGRSVVEVAAGTEHTCARKADGTLWCWGWNASAQLGDGTTADRSVPVEVRTLDASVAQVAAGAGHTCAITTDGALWCWGKLYARHPDTGTGTASYVPRQVPVGACSPAE